MQSFQDSSPFWGWGKRLFDGRTALKQSSLSVWADLSRYGAFVADKYPWRHGASIKCTIARDEFHSDVGCGLVDVLG
jgi:hypothetical protein